MKIQMNIPPNRPPLGVRTIALFEAPKGTIQIHLVHTPK
jgi:hypothetical protein